MKRTDKSTTVRTIEICRFGFSAAILALVGLAGVSVAAAETTDDTSLTSPPGCYTGTGCINSGFEVSTDGTTELGLTAILRFVGPESVVGNTYTLPAGTAGGYALWDYTFSINTQYAGGTATLSDYSYVISLTDTATSQTVTGNPLLIPDDAGYGSSGKVTGSTNPSSPNFLYVDLNQGALYDAQNSENFSFAGLGTPAFNPNIPDTYDITLSEYSGSNLVNSDTIVVDVVTPEPGTFFLLGFRSIALALVARKRNSFRA
jgi:hypothetical protein